VGETFLATSLHTAQMIQFVSDIQVSYIDLTRLVQKQNGWLAGFYGTFSTNRLYHTDIFKYIV